MAGPRLSMLVWLQGEHWAESQETQALALLLPLTVAQNPRWSKEQSQIDTNLSVPALTFELGQQCPLVSFGSAGASQWFSGIPPGTSQTRV